MLGFSAACMNNFSGRHRTPPKIMESFTTLLLHETRRSQDLRIQQAVNAVGLINDQQKMAASMEVILYFWKQAKEECGGHLSGADISYLALASLHLQF